MLPLLRARVQSLVGELISCKPCGASLENANLSTGTKSRSVAAWGGQEGGITKAMEMSTISMVVMAGFTGADIVSVCQIVHFKCGSLYANYTSIKLLVFVFFFP